MRAQPPLEKRRGLHGHLSAVELPNMALWCLSFGEGSGAALALSARTRGLLDSNLFQSMVDMCTLFVGSIGPKGFYTVRITKRHVNT
jgi:hypothetical protein